MSHVWATILATLKEWLLTAGGIVGATTMIAFGMRRLGRGLWAVIRQVREVHGVILGDPDQPDRPSLIHRLEQGDKRMGRIESDLGEVKGKVDKVEGFVDALADQERLEIRTVIAGAFDQEQQRPAGQQERRKHHGAL